MALFGCDRRFALIQHAHVPTQREGTQHKLGGRTFRLPAQQRLSKTHREPQHLDPASDGHPVMAVFMHGDQQTKRDDEGNDREKHVGGSVSG